MELHTLKYTKGSRGHKTRTYGRGFSSGLGKTSSHGMKGQHSRKSGNVRIGFEGGQTPIYRKIPKVGFNSYNFRKNVYAVSINTILKIKEKNINRETLMEHHIIGKEKYPIKIIGSSQKLKSEVSSLSFTIELMSTSLKEKLEKLGCKIKLLSNTK